VQTIQNGKTVRHTPVAGAAQHVTLQPRTEPQIAADAAVNAMTANRAIIIPTCATYTGI